MNMENWVRKHCRSTKDDNIVCVDGNEVFVLSVLGELADKPVTDENIDEFVEHNETYLDLDNF